jgi:hypothetical protein
LRLGSSGPQSSSTPTFPSHRNRECIPHDDEARSRLAPKGGNGCFDLFVAVNGRIAR